MVLLRSKLAIAALGAVALFWPSRAESPVGASALQPFGQVTVQHQLIHVPLVPPQRRVQPRGSTVQRVSGPPERRRTPGLAARASRILTGDGRYRPEPFPRPDR